MMKLTFLHLPVWIILSILFAPLGLAAPDNDNLVAAIDITTLPYTNQQITHEAVNEPAELLSKCFNDFTTKLVSASVWYQYTATRDQTVTLDTLGSDYDTLLSVWQGTRHPLTEVDCNDDNGNQIQSHLSLSLEKGTIYYINISGFRGATGNLILNANSVSSLTNDDLADAIEITPDANFAYNNVQNTKEASLESNELKASCDSNSQASVWYQYTANETQRVVFDTVSSDYNTLLSVWTGNEHPLEEMACDDGNGGPNSQVSVELTAGTTYSIRIAAGEVGGGSLLSQTGLLVFNMTLPPSNDDVANAIPINEPLPYLNSQNTGGATLESGELSPSCLPEAGAASVWYLYTPSTDYDNVIFSTVGSSYDTVLSLWQGTDHPFTEMACNNDVTVLTEQVTQLGSASQISLPMTKNEPIYINVSSASGDTGNMILRVEEGKRDFDITSYPNNPAITSCQNSNLNIGTSAIEGVFEVTQPLFYQWYQGESGDDRQLVAELEDEPVFTTPLLTETTPYWVRISNPTGTLESDTITVTVKENKTANGAGVDAEGNPVSTNAHFFGLVTTSPEETENIAFIKQTDTVFISYALEIDAKDIEEAADILIVAAYTVDEQTDYFMRNGEMWALWDENLAQLTSAIENTVLSKCLEVPVVSEGRLENLPGKFTVYVGYRLTSNGDILFSGEPITFSVE